MPGPLVVSERYLMNLQSESKSEFDLCVVVIMRFCLFLSVFCVFARAKGRYLQQNSRNQLLTTPVFHLFLLIRNMVKTTAVANGRIAQTAAGICKVGKALAAAAPKFTFTW